MDRINSSNLKKYNRSQVKHQSIETSSQSPNQPNRKRRKKRKFTKRKAIVLLALITILILILTGVFFLINKFIPVKDVDSSNIEINLSTTKPTGKAITALITTKTHYDIYYFVDYIAAQEEYYASYESNEESQTTEDTNINKESKKIDVKDIQDAEYKKLENSRFEITDNGVVYLKYGRFGKLSSVPYVFEITNIDRTGPEIGEITTTSTYTSITVTVNATDNSGGDLQYAFRLANSSNYVSTGTKNSYTFTDLTTDESYTIFVKATDSYGNESEAVTEAKASIEQEVLAEKKLYHFRVNYGANVVTVYEKDENGEYTKPIKAFICSTGKSTPKSGTYKISDRYRWRNLIGGVNGQYAVRIVGNILFHSVPYYQMYPNTLEYEEYDKLGTSASLGCVRLCVKDAKWIYDNAQTGSTVEFYSDVDDPGPLGKPTAQKISSNVANRNWDPTDPDIHNPWLGGDGAVTKITVINDDNDSSSTIIRNNNSKNTTSSTTIKNTTSNTSVNTVTDNVENTAITADNTVSNTVVEPEPITNTTIDPEPEPVTNTTVDPEPEPITNTTVDPEPEPVTNTTIEPDPEPEPTTNTVSTETELP